MHHCTDSEIPRSRNSSYSNSESGSSDKSHDSNSTHSTQYSHPSRPPFAHHETCEGRLEGFRHDLNRRENPRSSVETYASTVPSDSDHEESLFDKIDHPLPRPEVYERTATASTPADFEALFPSERLLSIRHDDSSADGNMSLRVDTLVEEDSRRMPFDMTLYYLRMHDLKTRDFALRRYCRESGREVCHSVRKYEKTAAERRTGLQRSLSHAFSSFRSISDHKTSHPTERLKRSDSGYESLDPRRSVETEQRLDPTNATNRSHVPIPSKTVKLEFANYAQVEVKRRGAKFNKRYEFEYWGVHYSWKRIVDKTASSKEVSFRLFRDHEAYALARISPTPLSGVQEREELSRGGWVPPSTMRITDRWITNGQNELADVIVSTGLIALVDDCIKRRFHTKPARGILIPIPKLRVDMEFIGSKRHSEECAKRPSTRGSTASRRPTTLRKASCDVY